MKATAERLENNRVALKIEVDAETVEKALERAYRKVARRVNVPGFRKGKVPRKILELRFGKEVLYDEALEELVPQAYREALELTQTDPIDRPSLSDITIEQGKPLSFRAEVEVKPDVKLGEYKGVHVEKLVEKVEPSDIDHILEHLRDENAQLVAVDRDEVQEGDFVVIDFEGFIDGKPFQGGAAKEYSLQVGSGRLVEGFEEQLIGARIGAETHVTVTYPEDYRSEALRGKEALFKVTVQSIKVRRLPDLDDEFAQDVSDAKTLLELRSRIRAEMEESAKRRAEEEMRERLLEKVRDAAEVEPPRVLVEQELDEAVNEFARSLAMRGINPVAYLKRTGRSLDDLRSEFRAEAEARVKTNLVLEAISKREGITVSQEELEAKIAELIDSAQNKEALRRQFEESDRREALKTGLVLEKTVDFLVEQADIEEKEVPSRGHGHVHHDRDAHDQGGESDGEGVHEESDAAGEPKGGGDEHQVAEA